MTIWRDKKSPNKSAWKANTAQQLAIGVEITICQSVGYSLSIFTSYSVSEFGLLYLTTWESSSFWLGQAGQLLGGAKALRSPAWASAPGETFLLLGWPCWGHCIHGEELREKTYWERLFWLWEIKQRLTSESWCLIPAPCAAFSLQFNAVQLIAFVFSS